MLPLSDATSLPPPSCFTRITRCLCDKRVTAVAQCVLFFGAAVGSLWIPIEPLAGATIGISLFLLYNKIVSSSQYSSPRNWKQIGVGSLIGGLAGLGGFSISDEAIGSALTAGGPLLGVFIAHSKNLWGTPAPAYGQLV